MLGGAAGADGTAGGEELKTTAYVITDGIFEQLARGVWAEPDPWADPHRDPFADEGADQDEAKPKLKHRVALSVKAPIKSRFFHEGDALFSVTGQLREAEILLGEQSWGIYNQTTQRLVLHGTADETEVLGYELESELEATPLLVGLSLELLEVPCRLSQTVE